MENTTQGTIIPEDVASDFLATFGTFGAALAEEIATGMTCSEIESFAGMLRALDASDAADSWINAHAEGDEEGDMHYVAPADSTT